MDRVTLHQIIGKESDYSFSPDSKESPGRSWVIHCEMADIRVFLSNLSDN